jgi:hypothetical protein
MRPSQKELEDFELSVFIAIMPMDAFMFFSIN